MNLFFSMMQSLLVGVLIFGVAGVILLATSPRTPKDEGVNLIVRLRRLTQERRQYFTCTVVILSLTLMTFSLWRADQISQSLWFDATDYIVQMRGEKEAVEAQNEQLKAENVALKTAMKPVRTTNGGFTIDGSPTVGVATIWDNNTLLLRDIDRQFAARRIPKMMFCDKGTCGISVRQQDAQAAREVVCDSAEKRKQPIVWLEPPTRGKE